MSIYGPDAVHEFPWASEDRVRRLEGREAIAAYMSEADGHHQRIAGDTPVDLSYIWFITVRESRVTHFRDYMNPLQLSTR
jgi:hypothetical protein